MNEIKSTQPSKLRKILIIAGIIILLLVIIFPLALNFFLKRKLPDLVNDKTSYTLQLKHFDLDLLSGNLTAENLIIKNKNPKDTAVAQINGNIGELKIRNFGVWKAIFSKTYKAQDLVLKGAKISVNLPEKKVKDTSASKKTEFQLENMFVSDADIRITKAGKKTLFNGQKVNIKLTEIQQSEGDSRMPFAFKEFRIDAQNVLVMTNPFYEVSARKIDAKNKKLSISQFHLKPLQNPKNYNAKNVFDFAAEELVATNFMINRDSLIVEDINFTKPNLKVTSTGKQVVKKKEERAKKMNLKIGLKNVDFKEGKILVQRSDLQKTASVDNFNFRLTHIVFDKNTVKEKIPFRFTNHNIEADHIYLKTDALQALKIGKIRSENQDIVIEDVAMIPLGKSSQKDVLDIQTDQVRLTKNQSKYVGQQLNLNFSSIAIINPKVKLYSASHKSKSAKPSAVIDFLASAGKVNILNGQFRQYKEGKEKLSVAHLDVDLTGVTSDKSLINSDIPFSVKNRMISAKGIYLDAGKYYNLQLASLKNYGKRTDMQNLEFLPKYSRKAFSKVIAKEEDLYTIRTKSISILDHNSQIGKSTRIHLDKIMIDQLYCNIYHDLAPPDDNAVRYLFGKKLRDVQFPLFVNEIQLRNSALTYEEDAENENKPGKLSFEAFNANIRNVNNARIKGLPTTVSVDSDFKFYGTAPTRVIWKFDVKDPSDRFTIAGDIQQLSADNVNLFVRPYLNVTLDGKIDYLKFDYQGSNAGIGGKFYFKYRDMYVNFLNKKNGKERKLLSTVANWFVKNESKGEPNYVVVDKKRDPEKSFFNMLWQGIMEGLKKYVI